MIIPEGSLIRKNFLHVSLGNFFFLVIGLGKFFLFIGLGNFSFYWPRKVFPVDLGNFLFLLS